jgi:hypothetical protein
MSEYTLVNVCVMELTMHTLMLLLNVGIIKST